MTSIWAKGISKYSNSIYIDWMKCSFLKSNMNVFCEDQICLVFVKTLTKRKHATFCSGLAIQVSSNRSEEVTIMYRSIPKPPMPPPPCTNPGAFDIFEKYWSNAPPVWASKRVKSLIQMCIERFSNDCRKTKTKAITPTNHNRNRQRHEPITIPSNHL